LLRDFVLGKSFKIPFFNLLNRRVKQFTAVSAS
jgi:hypothetical protein